MVGNRGWNDGESARKAGEKRNTVQLENSSPIAWVAGDAGMTVSRRNWDALSRSRRSPFLSSPIQTRR